MIHLHEHIHRNIENGTTKQMDKQKHVFYDPHQIVKFFIIRNLNKGSRNIMAQ